MNNTRRDLFKLLSVSGVSAATMPKRWVTPIVSGVILPTHAGTSAVLAICSCEVTFATVNSVTNEFSASYTITGCTSSITDTSLSITGPGVDIPLGYGQLNSGDPHTRTFTDVGPYNATVFQAGQSYLFTATVRISDDNDPNNGMILSSCDISTSAI